MRLAARHGRSTAISAKARAGRTGSLRALSSSTAPLGPTSTCCFAWVLRSFMSRSGVRPTSRSRRTRPGQRYDSGRCFCSSRLGGDVIGPALRQCQPFGGELRALGRKPLVPEFGVEDAINAEIAEIVAQLAPGAEQGDIDIVSHRDRPDGPVRAVAGLVEIGDRDLARFMDRGAQRRRIDTGG